MHNRSQWKGLINNCDPSNVEIYTTEITSHCFVTHILEKPSQLHANTFDQQRLLNMGVCTHDGLCSGNISYAMETSMLPYLYCSNDLINYISKDRPQGDNLNDYQRKRMWLLGSLHTPLAGCTQKLSQQHMQKAQTTRANQQ